MENYLRFAILLRALRVEKLFAFLDQMLQVNQHFFDVLLGYKHQQEEKFYSTALRYCDCIRVSVHQK
jgi:hypothetical protein